MLRPSAVAGKFYPETKRELAKMIDRLLTKERCPKIKGEVFGLLLPHAGYNYSGAVAACGFKAIRGRHFDTVIIIGDSHYERFDGVSVWPEDSWETPLGKVGVDSKLARIILAGSKRFFRRDSAHIWEHSAEVHLPFLQRTLKDFKILPIVFGSENKDWRELARIILKNIKNKRTLVIASADLSHYLPPKEAEKVDAKTIKNILNLHTDNLNICGIDSVKTIIEIAKNLKGGAELLKYAHSGHTAGDKTKVVGYGAVAFYK